MDDASLLKDYCTKGSELAFESLVRRYLPLIHNQLRRQLGDELLAQDATQVVFTLLAQRARFLQEHPTIAGWLHTTARQVGLRMLRTETRRRQRELTATAMSQATDSTENWQAMEPLIDEALLSLTDIDRNALLLRYFLQYSMRDVATTLGTSEAGAKMRVGRALERLRLWFGKRGLACSAGTVGRILEQNARPAASMLSAATITKAALFNASSLSGPSILSQLAMAYSKTKLLLAVSAIALVSTGSWWALHQDDESPADPGNTIAATRTRSPQAGESTTRSLAERRFGWIGAKQIDESRRMEAELIAALHEPQGMEATIWPHPATIAAAKAFGTNDSALLDILSREFQSTNSVVTSESRARIIGLLRDLPSNLPGLRDFLWKAARSEDLGHRASALGALGHQGLGANDIPPLMELLDDRTAKSPAVRSTLSRLLNQLIDTDPSLKGPMVTQLEQRLQDLNPKVRIITATALLRTGAGNEADLFTTIRQDLTQGDSISYSIAASTLSRIGSRAQPLADQLLEYARLPSTQNFQRRELLDAVARIDPTLTDTNPDVDQTVREIRTVQALKEALAAPNPSLAQLEQALQHPELVLPSATKLAELGPAATHAITALKGALEGRLPNEREQIVQAIQTIDPTQAIERIDAKVIMEAYLHAEAHAGTQSDPDKNAQWDQIMDKGRAFFTWNTPEEAAAAFHRLNRLDTNAAAAFKKKILEANPDLRLVFQ